MRSVGIAELELNRCADPDDIPNGQTPRHLISADNSADEEIAVREVIAIFVNGYAELQWSS